MAYRCPIDQQNFQKFARETKKLKVGLTTVLPKFSSNTGWADIERSLRKILLHFTSVDTPYIHQRGLLFRRLAQCLNPNIEEGVHKTVVEIYDKILLNVTTHGEFPMNEIFYVAMGIFPYLQVCSNQMKKVIFSIIDKYFLPQKEQLGPMVPALFAAIFPGLIENNAEIDQSVYNIMGALVAVLPPAYFYGAIWLVLFRSPKCRFGALKFLNYQLSKRDKLLSDADIVVSVEAENATPQIVPNKVEFDGQENLMDNLNPEFENNYQQNLDAYQQENGVAEENNYNYDENQNLNQGQEQIQITIADTHLQELENATEDYMQQNPDQNKNLSLNYEHDESGIRTATKNLLQPDTKSPANDSQSAKDSYALALKPEQENLNASNSQIISQAVPENNEEAAAELRADVYFVQETSVGEFDLFIANCKKLWTDWNNYLAKNCRNPVFPNKQMVITAIKASLADESVLIKRKTLDFIITFASRETNVFTEQENIQIFKSCLELLESSEYSLKRRVFSLVFGTNDEEEDDRAGEAQLPDDKTLDIIMQTLRVLFNECYARGDTLVFKVLQTIFMDKEELIDPVVSILSKEILQTLVAYPQEKRMVIGDSFFISIYSYFFIFADAYTARDGSQITVEELRVLTKLGTEHFEFPEGSELIDGIPSDLYAYHQRLGFYTASREIDKEAIEKEEDDLPLEGSNVAHLLRLKVLRGYLKVIALNPLSSEAALRDILDLNIQWPDLHFNRELELLARSFLDNFGSSLNSKANIKGISLSIFEQALRVGVWALQKLNNAELIDDWAAKLENFLQSVESSPKYCLAAIKGIAEFIAAERSDTFRELNEAAIKTAWRLLDDIRFHGPAFTLISELGRVQIDLMVEMLNAKLGDEEIAVRVDFLQRIVIFWKLGSTQQPVDGESGPTLLEEALTFTLLDHLEDGHPVLRQIAKSWLIDCTGFLWRVLDPLLAQLSNNCKLFPTISGRSFHSSVFQVPAVLEAFRRLKFMVNNNPTKFASFAVNAKLSPTAQRISHQSPYNKNDKPIDPAVDAAVKSTAERVANPEESAIHPNNYAALLINYTVRFLRSGVLPFMGRRFRQDNLLISTAACELLELVVKTVLTVDATFLSEAMVELLLQCYYQFVRDESSVMQINMINLLKVILFQSGFLERNTKNLSLFERIFREKKLLENVIGSIKNNRSSHTLLKIVDFLQTTTETFSNRLFPETKLKEVVSLIFESYFLYITEEDSQILNQQKFDAMVVLVEAVFRLAEKYFNLQGFKLPWQINNKGSMFVSIMTLGVFGGGEKVQPSNFPLIEAYFLENFEKLILILVKGWKTVCLAEEDYRFTNLGPEGYSDDIGYVSKPAKERTSVANVRNSVPVVAKNINDPQTNQEFEMAKRTSVVITNVLTAQAHNHIPAENDELCRIAEKLFYKYHKHFFEALLKVWAESFPSISAENALKPNSLHPKIVDLLLFLKVSTVEFNKALFETNVFKDIKNEKRRNRENKVLYKVAHWECAILALYFSLLRYREKSFIEDKIQRKIELRNIWTTLFEFLQAFNDAQHVQTDLWVINIYHLAAIKYPVQEIISEYTIKKTLHIHENAVLEKIVGFICDEPRYKVTFEKEPERSAYAFLFPLPALLVDTARESPQLYVAKLTGVFEEDFHLRYYTKIVSLKFLKQVTIQLLKLTYASKTNNRIARRVYNIVAKLFLYIESLLKNKMAINDNLYVEIIEYLFIFLDDSREFLMNALDPLIERFFDSELFFECPTRSLGLWAKIIGWHVSLSQQRVLAKYLYKFDDSLFHSQQVQGLLDNIKNILLDPNARPKLTIILYFCLRIIIIKTSTKTCIEIFKLLWPILLSQTIMILNNEVAVEDFNIKLAAMKLLEVVAVRNPDAFNIHYWILGYDFFGLRFDEMKGKDGVHAFCSPFPFVPFLTKLYKRHVEVTYDFVQNELPDGVFIDHQPRDWVVTENRVDSDDELSQIAERFLLYVSDTNRRAVEPPVDFDTVIIEDFKRLNEFSLK